MDNNTSEQKPPKRKRSYYTPQPITPTPMQRSLARNVSEVIAGNMKVRTSKELMIKSGYSLTQSNKPSAIMHSQGMIVALNELGLTKEKIVPMLMDDLNNNPGRRWLGLSIAGKWLGLEQRDPPQTQNNLIGQANIVIQLPPKE